MKTSTNHQQNIDFAAIAFEYTSLPILNSSLLCTKYRLTYLKKK